MKRITRRKVRDGMYICVKMDKQMFYGLVHYGTLYKKRRFFYVDMVSGYEYPIDDHAGCFYELTKDEYERIKVLEMMS